MTLDDLKRQNRRFYAFFGNFGLHTSLYHTQGGAMQLLLCDPDIYIPVPLCLRTLKCTKLN